jgi:cytochrome P450
VLGWSFWHLATHPEDQRWVAEDSAIVSSAVEEFLRAYPIVSMARKLTQDVEFHGCPMKKDDMVLLAIQAATRDPEVFPDPDAVRLDRSPNRHIAFGASEHRCPGSHLARAELQLSDEADVQAHGGQISLISLPLVWDRAR